MLTGVFRIDPVCLNKKSKRIIEIIGLKELIKDLRESLTHPTLGSAIIELGVLDMYKEFFDEIEDLG